MEKDAACAGLMRSGPTALATPPSIVPAADSLPAVTAAAPSPPPKPAFTSNGFREIASKPSHKREDIMKTILAIALAGTLLTGCAGRYVPLYVVSQPSADQTTQQRLTDTLTRLHGFGERFARTYRRSSQQADLAQVPLIGAAVALGLIAVNQPANAADTIAKIGIGTGIYTVGRSVAMPSGGPETFRKGVHAINCVLVEGPAFIGTGVTARVNDLSTNTKMLDTYAARVANIVGSDVVPDNDAEKKEMELAKANARLALARAATASQAARGQIGAYENAPAEFDRAASTIISTLASKSAVHTVIDPSALAASWTKPPEAGAAGGAQGLGQTGRGYIIKLNEYTQRLDDQTALVSGLVGGFQFVDRLKAVATCPTLV